MIHFADGSSPSSGAAIVTSDAELTGAHVGAIQVSDGAHLLISGSLAGAVGVAAGSHVTLTGTVHGSIVVGEGGTFLAEEGSDIHGATHGVVSFGRRNGASD